MINKLFLEALQASLKIEKVKWEHDISSENWQELFALAEAQHVLPMIYDAVYSCPAAKKSDPKFFSAIKGRVYKKVMLQAMKTEEFLKLYGHLVKNGIRPILVKGLICRQLYPNPDYRSSSDEDLLVSADEFVACHKALLEYGMTADPEKSDVENYDEIAYRKEGSPLYIELHRSLFAEKSEAYGDFNRFFKAAHQETVTVSVSGTDINTMSHTLHLLYLILHAFKHFLHGGVGIRQVCDISLYANEYGRYIDWADVTDKCAEVRADKFAFALIKIGKSCFELSAEKSCCHAAIYNTDIDETYLLEDILSGGVYGGATKGRKHSSNVTLNAVSSQKKGNAVRGSVIRTLLPSVKKLSGKYKYLEKYPFLLPVAWYDRIVGYIKESRREGGVSEAAKIGKDRIELLKIYNVID
ncbi:MAG: nucleotidyltransferase family protein [Oscillospiraceae bacterium]|nr:nucleotidyltransferase family protein [Oscillospiraceae bacterium]